MQGNTCPTKAKGSKQELAGSKQIHTFFSLDTNLKPVASVIENSGVLKVTIPGKETVNNKATKIHWEVAPFNHLLEEKVGYAHPSSK